MDVMHRCSRMTVEVPARLLHDLISLAQGYTMSRGEYLNKSALTRAGSDLLYNAGYENYGDESMFQYVVTGRTKWGGIEGKLVPREDLT